MSLKRLPLLGQCILATALTVLWLWWNPLSPDCGDGGGDCGAAFDPFVGALQEPSSVMVEEVADGPLVVEHGRCHTVVTLAGGGLECIYEPGSELRLWVVHPRSQEVTVALDGQQVGASTHGEQGELGTGLRVGLSGDVRRLSVHVPGEEPWLLPLRATTRLTDDERSALARFEQRGLLLEAHLTLGRLEMLPYTRELVEEMLEQGMIGKAVEEVLITSHHLTHGGWPDLAHQLIEALPPLDGHPWGVAAASIYNGNALLEQGRLVDAAAAFRDGSRYAIRVGDPGLQSDGLTMYAQLLAELGYFEAADAWGSWVRPVVWKHGRPVDRVNVSTTLGWANVRLREAGKPHEDPGPWFREALSEAEGEEPWADVGELDPARLGLATVAVLDGNPALALRWLEQIDETTLTSDQRVEARDVRLRALLAARGTSAREEIRAALAELEAAAERAVSPGARWRAAVRKGFVLEEEGDLAGAKAAYEDAEALLDRLTPMGWVGVPAKVGATAHTEGTERLVSVLLRQGQAEQALCVARRAQARRSRLALLLRRLDPRTREELRPLVKAYQEAKLEHERLLLRKAGLAGPTLAHSFRELLRVEQLLEQREHEILAASAEPPDLEHPTSDGYPSPREPGELLLALYPHLGSVVVFVQDDEETTYRVMVMPELGPEDDTSWLGPLLLDPLGERLRRAERVRVLAAGWPTAIPVHALPWQGQPLAVQVPVVYGLELPAVAPHSSSGTTPSALVLEDPKAKGTALEADVVVSMLRASGWTVRLEASTTTLSNVLLEGLGEVDHFHYAGHANYGAGDEPRRWPPYLGGTADPAFVPLGEGRLGVQDVLMMERVPRTVVLMGCDTGVQDERMDFGGFSLATAFVAAGSAAVVASTWQVDGDDASLVGRGLYEAMTDGVVGEPGEWFKDGLLWAQQQGLRDGAEKDYRVFVP